MLSRAAGNLFWLGRYMERAESIARLVEVGLRMSSLSVANPGEGGEWHSALVAAGCEKGFYAKHELADAQSTIDYLVSDPDNPSSILSCFEIARRNARSVRTSLTTDCWEAVNGTWLEARQIPPTDFTPGRVRRVLDWVKERSLLFSGAVANTQLRTEPFWFLRLGGAIERGDNTARILDVKYHVLLPAEESVGGTLDYYQWTAILRSVSALRSYHAVYRERLKPLLVAELLIFRAEVPRSLHACVAGTADALGSLSNAYGTHGEADRLTGQLHARLRYGRVDKVFQSGLHEFLTEYIETNIEIGNEIGVQFLF